MSETYVMASVADLARGLQRRCETISGLHCYDVMHPSPQAPAVCVEGPVRWTYDETMDGAWRPVFNLHVYFNPANLPDAQRQLFAYVAPTGRQSIPAAIYGDPSLGGVASDTRILGGPRGAAEVDQGGKLLSLVLEVEVWAM